MKTQQGLPFTAAEMQLHKRMARLQAERRKAAETSKDDFRLLWIQPAPRLLLEAPKNPVLAAKAPALATRLIQSIQKWLMHPLINFRTQEYL
jgi:hypothetical protein